ncbi:MULTISPECIES: ABC transporter permease [Brevibacillus]|jgi:peptide/nickel transport system permease protein|uniref:Binding-protein-dependent transporters inner membrane component n=1 Tax=Brevibacillus borstelensis AK1 TaxID=1300222 RepID=M8E146_9BACL|nr:ABC transporter permease [Brevibacillus borstelensis]EMT53001.1 binding-protein-dependent transporters inner membrane component [Brevibacillus borstelensis AK1]KKX55591.1 glutathione ABC transporter permease [Brevibacillus borstelensis cifa_chp40]MBE5397026.1 ABC transporter permease [Brevibacillus borstelensis]MCC0563364.1 ABC transporter permease [Brevibacillus borstelensis]MCM3471375.1 ABC transporter permease [Brevibacillus borstelensis]
MRTFRRRFFENKTAVVCLIVLLLLALAAAFAPVLSPYDPTQMFQDHRMEGSSGEFILGTDQFGRDIMSRIIYGARVSLMVGISSVLVSVAFGTLFGLIAGYFGRWIDGLVMRVMDVLFAFPEILLALAIVAALGPGAFNTILAIGIVNIPIFTRTVRGAVLSIKNQEYVESARAIGASTPRILFLEIFPNVTAPLLVQASLAISGAILTESALSFLGLGIQPPDPSWGGMISEARRYMELAPGMIIWPCVAMTITILSCNMFGDAVRDILDPRHRGK